MDPRAARSPSPIAQTETVAVLHEKVANGEENRSLDDSPSPTSAALSFGNDWTEELMGGKTSKDAPPLPSSAPPPPHSVAAIVASAAVFVRFFPSAQSLDCYATVTTFAVPLFPALVPSPLVLGLVRLSFAAVVFGTQAAMIFGGPEFGWTQRTSYLPQSKLVAVPFRIEGWRTLAPFTSCAWMVLGTSFLMSGVIALLAGMGREDVPERYPGVLRLALVLWETAAPVALMVSSVVRYAIWPACLNAAADTENGDSGTEDRSRPVHMRTEQLKRPTALLQHNANAIMVLIEVGLLGGLPVRPSHVSVAPLFGISYVLFTWAAMRRWSDDGSAQFVYWFLDTTLGRDTTFALLVLLGVLLASHGTFCVMDGVLEQLLGGWPAHAVAVAGLASLVCRFRD